MEECYFLAIVGYNSDSACIQGTVAKGLSFRVPELQNEALFKKTKQQQQPENTFE